jgi:hypothetical protein
MMPQDVGVTTEKRKSQNNHCMVYREYFGRGRLHLLWGARAARSAQARTESAWGACHGELP